MLLSIVIRQTVAVVIVDTQAVVIQAVVVTQIVAVIQTVVENGFRLDKTLLFTMSFLFSSFTVLSPRLMMIRLLLQLGKCCCCCSCFRWCLFSVRLRMT